MRSNYEAIKRAAERGVPMAKRALETVEQSVQSLEGTCIKHRLVRPDINALREKVSEALVVCDPWLASSLDGRRYRYRQRELEAA